MKNRSILLVTILLGYHLLVAQNAPVTSVTTQYGCTIGSTVTVPIAVTNYTNIGAFSLDLEYDPLVMTYVQGIINPLLNGSFLIGDNVLPNGKHHVVISWFGEAASLADGSTLLDINFQYLGGTTELKWIDDGASCEFADAFYIPLNDLPPGCYYVNGLVTPEKSLSISLILQGFYDSGTQLMVNSLGEPVVPCGSEIADHISIELHNSSDYSLIEYAVSDVNLTVNGSAGIRIPAQYNGSYYLTIIHRNSIRTTSASPVSFSGNLVNYNFTTDASKAFGSNLIQMTDGKWAIFGGDANQDDIVDSGDMILVDNDVSNFATGYLPSDCNGDGLVDSSDMVLVDNNSSAFVTAVLP